MNIVEAVKKAMEQGKGIQNAKVKRAKVYLLPTNTTECFFVIPVGYRFLGNCPPPATRWQPQAEDILAEDWEVTE